MARNLVICFDGTNNQFGPQNTSVVRLVQVINRDPTKQRLYYDPGVGTLPEPSRTTSVGKRISEWMGLAFGLGLTAKVAGAYAYLMNFWEPGDQVYVFGFSRGAYTARVLAGMLHALGLLPRGNDNLVPYVMRLFRGARGLKHEEDVGKHEEDVGKHEEDAGSAGHWKLCREFRWTFARPARAGDDERRFPVHFLGLWDTVSSVGWAWDPVRFPYTAHNPSVEIIRHAVAIDERRWFFRQNQMYKSAPTQDFGEQSTRVHAEVPAEERFMVAHATLRLGPSSLHQRRRADP